MIGSYGKSGVRSRKIGRVILIPLICIMVVLLLLRVGLIISGQTILPIRSVQVSGTRFVSNAEVVSLLDLGSRDSLLFMNLEGAREAVMRDHRVKRVQMVKVYPETLRVHVREKEGVAVVGFDGDSYLLTGDGVVLARIEGAGVDRVYSEYPSISLLSKDDDIKIGNPVDNALLGNLLDVLPRFYEEEPEFGRRIESFAIDQVGIWTRIADAPYRVYLGGQVSVDKLHRLRNLIVVLEQKRGDGPVESSTLEIDMSFSHAAVREGDRNDELR
jgi:hypothetical protein